MARTRCTSTFAVAVPATLIPAPYDGEVPDESQFDGAKMRSRRQEMKLTQVAVARWVGVGQTAVSQWETGAVQPSTRNLLRLCYFLDCNPMDLVVDQH